MDKNKKFLNKMHFDTAVDKIQKNCILLYQIKHLRTNADTNLFWA